MTIDPHWLDRVNAAAEFAVLLPFCIDLRALMRARDTRAVTLQAQLQYLACCLWGTFYFWQLQQLLTFGSCCLWVLAYTAKIAVLLRARRRPDRL